MKIKYSTTKNKKKERKYEKSMLQKEREDTNVNMRNERGNITTWFAITKRIIREY